jgi:hypothetical protein
MQTGSAQIRPIGVRKIAWIQWGFRSAIAAYALIISWISRYRIDPDGVSYLDMGDLYWIGNWKSALNSYWSPLYSWMTGLIFHLTKPTMRWEYPEVHLLNFFICIATLLCFEFFWRELLASRSGNELEGTSLTRAWALGYLLFACVSFTCNSLNPWNDNVALVTPDFLVSALVYLASGLMLRFASGRMHGVSAASMGIILGLGYLAKAAMLPFAFVILATMLGVVRKRRSCARFLGMTLICFLMIAAPFIAAISYNNHRFTFGDAGKLNVAWFVNDVTPAHFHWQGDGRALTQPQHTTRKLLNWPEVYEFATPVAGTYPVWYDPTYWWAGVDTHMHPAHEIARLRKNFFMIGSYLTGYAGQLTSIVLLMALMCDQPRDFWRKLKKLFPVLIPAVAMCLMYAMVIWEPRYTVGFLLVVCGALCVSACRFDEEHRSKVLQAAILVLGVLVVWGGIVNVHGSYRTKGFWARQIEAAEKLRAMGIESGSRVAVIGDGFEEEYWARLAKFVIIAEVPHSLETGDSSTAFWNSDQAEKQVVLDALKSTGAKAVVAQVPLRVPPPGWTQVNDAGLAVYFLQ